jgi:hypothetical protein
LPFEIRDLQFSNCSELCKMLKMLSQNQLYSFVGIGESNNQNVNIDIKIFYQLEINAHISWSRIFGL